MKRVTAVYTMPKTQYRAAHRATAGVVDWDGRRLRLVGYVYKTYYTQARNRKGRFSRGKLPVCPRRGEYVPKAWAVLAAEILSGPHCGTHEQIAERCGVHVRTLQRALKKRSFLSLVEAVRAVRGTAPARLELGRRWDGHR